MWIGETVSKLRSNVTTVALPLVAMSVLNAGTLGVGLITAAVWLPWLLVALPAGAWIDRLPRRPVMLVCDVVSAVLFVSVPVAAWLGVLTMGQLLAVAALTGMTSVIFTTAYKIYLPEWVPAGELVEGNAKLQGSESVAQVGGRGVAGLIAPGHGGGAGENSVRRGPDPVGKPIRGRRDLPAGPDTTPGRPDHARKHPDPA